jgi:FMN phosphatase YigB (HAD superfamily)
MDADPARTVFVGDNPVADMAGAKAAGMWTAWYAPPPVDEKPAAADFHFDRHETLLAWCAERLA